MSGLLMLMLAMAAQDAPYRDPPVAEPVLADQRGGFRLPNGIDVSITVQTDTAINGQLVLRTVFAANQGPASVAIYAPKAGETVASTIPATSTASRAASSPTISYDARGGIQVTPGVAMIAPSVGTGKTAAAGVPPGLEQVAGGAHTDNGTISQTINGGARTVTLNGDAISITHLTGNALGSAIANSGSDRTIDTQTSVSIDLHGAGPDVIGSTMLRVEAVALGAVASRLQ